MMENKLKKTNNKGFSLIEVLVVIIIIGITTSLIVFSYDLVNKTNVTKATTEIDECMDIAIQKAMSISAYEWNVTITDSKVMVVKITESDGDSGMEYNYETVESRDLPDNVSTSITDQSGNTYYISGNSEDYESVSIVFQGLTGEVKSIYYTQEGIIVDSLNLTDNSYCDIYCNYKSNNSIIRLYYITGKHKIL